MTIKTKLLTSVIISFFIVAAVGIVLSYSFKNIQESSKKNRIVSAVVKNVFELNILMYDYLAHPLERARIQWQIQTISIEEHIRGLESNNPEVRIIVENLIKSNQDINSIFIRLVEISEKTDLAGPKKLALLTELKERLTHRLFIRSQSMVESAHKLDDIYKADMLSAQQRVFLFIIVFMIILVIWTSLIAVSFERSLLRPIMRLRRGTKIVAGGDLDYKIGLSQKDEIGKLSRSFDEMTMRLKSSRAVLQDEITERNKAEEELKKVHEEIEAWNRELETRVREKTDELIKSQAQVVQADKLSSIGQMAAGIAHELNSPLTGLISMISHYKKGAEKDSKEHRELSLMSSACEYMAKIVKDFNTFSCKSRGEITECNLNEIIESSLGLITNELKAKNIQITKDHADEHPMIIKGDRTELQQVAMNIIRNAVDAMDDGGELVIKSGISEDKSSVILKFIDNGCGIKKENIDSVFEPFFTTKPPGKGTGLGLSVSYAIVKNHEGKIKVESEAGKGTEFEVLLPAVT